ncbi:RpsU-divergently transcribed [Ketogulonicigenium robustum]|uniref:RpsU-divergently transcribed n=1 Tax=Ketogulonicigenium robustum TaxID=92947 RepID=A0A1W6NWJ2_9RHOB|nr:COQ9 family protein [Ketogulonicigenium robustum]ARO13595.1 RpsU-divergently transcribed [Ketogulonicigenium robustum]
MQSDAPRDRLMQAMGQHVLFDGWSEAAFAGAAADAGVDLGTARVLFPRGALDVAVALHRQGDSLLTAPTADGIPLRARMAVTIMQRLALAGDRQVVRSTSALFALPQHAAEGAKLIWGTADAIWVALGDTSDDYNWYTKRMTLSAVYSASVLYWLGQDDDAAVAAFVERRIRDALRLQNPAITSILGRVLRPLHAPRHRDDLPGRWG